MNPKPKTLGVRHRWRGGRREAPRGHPDSGGDRGLQGNRITGTPRATSRLSLCASTPPHLGPETPDPHPL